MDENTFTDDSLDDFYLDSKYKKRQQCKKA